MFGRSAPQCTCAEQEVLEALTFKMTDLHVYARRATQKGMAAKISKMQLRAARKQMKQTIADATPQQRRAQELLRKHGTDNPTMLISYYDEDINNSRCARNPRRWRLPRLFCSDGSGSSSPPQCNKHYAGESVANF